VSVSSPLLIAYDGSDLARHAIQSAAALFHGGRAVVLHVYEPLPMVATPVGAAMATSEPDLAGAAEQVDEAAGRRALDIARHGAKEAERAGLSATSETALASGTSGIAEAIVEKAVSIGASLIVLGSHGRSAIGAALLGSVSTAVLHRSSVPVLVVPARPEADEDGR
jgi:nucleotide-binding universal stress UspA family protein